MATWTKKLIAKQLRWSDVCYRKAILSHYGYLLNDEQKKLPLRELKAIICDVGDIDMRLMSTPEVTAIYLKNLCRLSTDKIELIVEAYNKGKQFRSPSTIDVLLSELFERATNPQRRKDE